MTVSRQFACLSAVAAAFFTTAVKAADESVEEIRFSPGQIEFFENQVRPLLVEHCHKCHSDRAQKGNLRLDSRAALLTGGDTGPAVVPGKPEKSLLIDAVEYGELYQMPPSGKLSEKQIAVLRRWVEQGAPWANDAAVKAAQQDEAGPAFDLWRPISHSRYDIENLSVNFASAKSAVQCVDER